MGAHAGFDMVPPLSKGADDVQDWTGEHPRLPFEGHKFRRFSSKITGSTATSTNVDQYISMVTSMAKMIFGYRVQTWNELADQLGFYGWDEVYSMMETWDKPDEAKPDSPDLTTAEQGQQAAPSLRPDLFEVQQIPGKGRGLVALSDIAKGTRIISESPLFTTANMAPPNLQEAVASKLKALSKEQQRQFLSLHNNFPGRNAFAGIFRTNALPCGCDAIAGGIYPTICLINHSCLPNAHNNWNSEHKLETIHAIKPIKAGEEITIDYSRGDPSSVRHEQLREAFGFDCQCTVCSRPQQELKLSDARRREIQSLDDNIGNPTRMLSHPCASLADCRSLLRLSKEEYGETGVVLEMRLYYDAFQISAAHSDRTRASAFAERAYRARVICEGEDSPVTQQMKRFVENPALHSTFGCYSTKWKGSNKFSPSSLSPTEFEAWLWRHAK
ncbi:SET domain-containing protein [Hypoxylon sp. FL0543]|nr:SET domain-containing protein [Hypoxylon sp. FL0543]